MALKGRIPLRAASDRMQISYRHAKRFKGGAARDGPRGLVHGNTERCPGNAVDGHLREKIVALSRTEYDSFNDTHFTEKLASVEGIRISRKQSEGSAGGRVWCPKDAGGLPWHRPHRARKPHEGMMVLWDGSVHRWFGDEHHPRCLISAIHDAASRCLVARFPPLGPLRGICGWGGRW